MQTIAVVGPGQMGMGISQLSAAAGYHVLLSGRDLEHAALAKSKIDAALAKLEARNKIDAATRAATLERIEPIATLDRLSEADIVIESVPEQLGLKSQLLERLAPIVKADGIVATNTSSLSITSLAKSTGNPDRFVGLHFFYPAPQMRLVELTKGLGTTPETALAARTFAESLGKTVVEISDSPGFVVNRLLIPMLNEAVFALTEGVSSIRDIDAAVKLGLNHPMGPFALADFIGLDTCLEILRVLHAGTGDPKFRPAPLLVKYVEAGWLGRKSGRGFYDYTTDEPQPTR